jgi:hypothetical protein
MKTYDFASVVRGFHVYRVYWTPAIGEVLETELDSDSLKFGDVHAVSVMLEHYTMGHVHMPKEFSKLVNLFILYDGLITCKITGNRQRSSLAQGGLEVPCVYVFRAAKPKLLSKLRVLLDAVSK